MRHDLAGEGQLIERTFYSAYIVFASTVELLGRCVRGNDTKESVTDDLRTGFKWLAAPTVARYQSVGKNDILMSTTNYQYSIEELVNLRQFCAHGQGINKNVSQEKEATISRLSPRHNLSIHGQAPSQPITKDFDYLILAEMPPLIGDGMEAYLIELMSNEDLANNLAKAFVTPYRSRPILDSIYPGPASIPADADTYPASIGNVFRIMDWTYKAPYPFRS